MTGKQRDQAENRKHGNVNPLHIVVLIDTVFCSDKSILFAARNTDNSGDFTKIYQITGTPSIVNRIQKTYFCVFSNNHSFHSGPDP
jgi:hypothetical protein